MDATKIFKKYIEIKQAKEKENIPAVEKNAYLSGWLDCANSLISEEKND